MLAVGMKKGRLALRTSRAARSGSGDGWRLSSQCRQTMVYGGQAPEATRGRRTVLTEHPGGEIEIGDTFFGRCPPRRVNQIMSNAITLRGVDRVHRAC